MELKLMKTNLDGVADVYMTSTLEKGDFIILGGEEALYKLNSIDEKDLNLSIVKNTELDKEILLSYAEWNVKIGNKKYFIKDKLGKNQRIKIDNHYYEIIDVIKIDKTKKELVLNKIETKKIVQVYTVKKVYFNERNKIGQFKKEVVGVYPDFQDAIIAIYKFKVKNSETGVGYSL